MFEAKIKLIKIDRRGYTEALGKAVDVQIRQAARAWLREVMIHIPVYSGMAKGSLLPLGRFLNVAIPIQPVAKRKYGDVAAGDALGSFKFERDDNFVWTFSFSTEVPHFLINEFNVGLGSPPLRHPTPWNSFAAGKVAWTQYLTTELSRKIPKISEWITLEDTNG